MGAQGALTLAVLLVLCVSSFARESDDGDVPSASANVDVSSNGTSSTDVEVSSTDSSASSTRSVTRSTRSLRRRHKEWVPPTAEEESVVDAHNAAQAEVAAHSAADVATNVATHSIHVTEHAQSALKHAHEVLHNARVETEGLSRDQRDLLKTAETKLRTATKTADYGKIEQARYDMRKLHDKLGARETHAGEAHSMRDEVRNLREELRHSQAGRQADASAEALDQEMADLDASMQGMDANATNGDELKAEVERLRETVHRYEEAQDTQEVSSERRVEVESAAPDPPSTEMPYGSTRSSGGHDAAEVVDVDSKRIDIDTEMPYGELEPFGREDTAQELTEASIRESDEMVDQLERAEVAEEKRAVFRSLTRLRGAAITSFDGVARAQTGNIDEYNKVHKWRKTHPLHHLADEESDISKWAFPDNADF